MTRVTESTKIVCTIGPASSKPVVIEGLIKAGMDVARLNFSHGSYESHSENIKTIRAKSAKCKKPVAILQDLSGPKVRIGKVKNGSCFLKRNSHTILTADDIEGTEERLSISYKNLAKEVTRGENIFLNDGLIKLRVEKVSGKNIECRVIIGGIISSNKGVNLPDTNLNVPSLTQKDLKDAEFGMKLSVDMVALSFVRKPDDILQLRNDVAGRSILAADHHAADTCPEHAVIACAAPGLEGGGLGDAFEDEVFLECAGGGGDVAVVLSQHALDVFPFQPVYR